MRDQIDEARFWPKVDKGGPDECWLWKGAAGRRADSGYGYYTLSSGRQVGAHRVSFALSGRTVEDGEQIDHLCRNRLCVNPAHLECVTSRENTLRGQGPTALNARKTHCSHGHELSGDNLIVRRQGWRACRACKRILNRDHMRRAYARTQNTPDSQRGGA